MTNRLSNTAAAILLLVLVCFVRAEPPSAPPAGETTGLGGPVTVKPDYNDEELAALCKQLEDAYNATDAAAVSKCLDMNAMVDRVFLNIAADPKLESSLRAGLTEPAMLEQFVAQLRTDTNGTGGVRYLRNIVRDGQTRALFRVVGDQGLNYHEYLPQRVGDRLVFSDIYLWIVAEDFSNTFRRIVLQEQASQLGKDKQQLSPQLQANQKMQAAIKAGDFAGAIAVYDALDPKYRKDKLLQAMHVKAAGASGDQAAIIKALTEYAKLFKGDPTVDLITLDVHAYTKQYDDADAALTRIDTAIGGDPYIQFLRANNLREQNQVDQAISTARAAIEQEPTLIQPGLLLLSQYTANKDYRSAANTMRDLETRTTFVFGDLKEMPEFAEFAKSKEYEQFIAERPRQ